MRGVAAALVLFLAGAALADTSPSLSGLDAEMGRALFERLWVAAPASTRAADGLGPLYNARACSACHVGHGRAHPPEGDGPVPVGIVARLAMPGGEPDPVFGTQVQPLATGGLAGEGAVRVHWQRQVVTLGDGTPVTLRRPEVQTDAPLDPATRASLRAAPPLIAPGLVAAIPEAQLFQGDTGRLRLIDGIPARFGRRASSTTLEGATQQALFTDMGLSTPAHPAPWGDCTPSQTACRSAPHGDGDVRVHEVTGGSVALIAAHLARLAPPPTGTPDPAGEALFHTLGCAACHRPSYTLEDAREIRPYSDFRLHDLGPGLADPAPEAGVAPGEWRTAPLWGHTGQSWLHDGRALSLTEAILWHGGAAQGARDGFAALPAPDRAALIRFLESL